MFWSACSVQVVWHYLSLNFGKHCISLVFSLIFFFLRKILHQKVLSMLYIFFCLKEKTLESTSYCSCRENCSPLAGLYFYLNKTFSWVFGSSSESHTFNLFLFFCFFGSSTFTWSIHAAPYLQFSIALEPRTF